MMVKKIYNVLCKVILIYRKSLALRFIVLSTLWVVIALISISTISMFFYRQANEQNFDRILTAHLYSLISAVNVSSKDVLQGHPELGDIRYSDPLSGWYWEVIAQTKNLHGHLSSPSLGNHTVVAPSESDVLFDSKFFRFYNTIGPNKQTLRVIESDVVLDNQNRVARFRIMGNLDESYKEIKRVWETLKLFLWAFSIGTILINIFIIAFSLRPLRRIRKSLEDIRKGKACHVDIDLPVEVLPLATEMNALIDNNVRIVERFRTQVGNLAHSLKTPLSVLINESHKMKSKQGALIIDQTTIMQAQINHYLQRARIAAQRDSVIYHTSVRDVVERLIRVMQKINPDKKFIMQMNCDDIIFIGEKEDLEEIVGNLLENAAKWSESSIYLTCCNRTADAVGTSFEICIEDDGPGLDEKQKNTALIRGRRLDEAKPGTGLGLSIVVELINEYSGTLKLSKAKTGGLSACVRLPQGQSFE